MLKSARVLLILCLSPLAFTKPAQAQTDVKTTASLSAAQLTGISGIVSGEIAAGRIPGAVVVIGDQNHVIYRQAFGNRSTLPTPLPMQSNTIFDLASLTKVVATTPAIMRLIEDGKLGLDDPVVKYWPEFAANGKAPITVRQLLTHYSGLRADIDPYGWSGYDAAMARIAAEKPRYPVNTHYIYSDINFEILGELVRRVSGMGLDEYCQKYIFAPLGMQDTAFRPPEIWRERVAPTEYGLATRRWSDVHDPTSFRMGGVSGHAGLFSDGNDLAIFAQMLLNQGQGQGQRKGANILTKNSVLGMGTPQTPAGKPDLRGFGWEILPSLASNAGGRGSVGAFGHTGYTGTFLRIDPVTGIYVIILTNRVYPDGRGDARALRSKIVSFVADRLGPVITTQKAAQVLALGSSLAADQQPGHVLSGIDVLKQENFASLRGLRLGLITNQTGVDRTGSSTISLLRNAPGIRLTALLTPEHGLHGDKDQLIMSGTDKSTQLPVYSLYGQDKRPTADMLENIDALVYDIQDVGVRFYTYISTMAYAMEAAAHKGIPFYVLDRPNPIDGSVVQGPVMDGNLKSFTGYFPMPARYGMTAGEVATMLNTENHMGVTLRIIKMKGYARNDWYDATGLPWVAPSPNLRTLTQATLYPGVAMTEAANVSVGRGTDTPFELLGAPWIQSDALAKALNARKIPGVSFEAADFTPNDSNYARKLCHGVRIRLVDRQALDAALLGVELVSSLHDLYPNEFKIDATLSMVGSKRVLQAIKATQDPQIIAQNWQKDLAVFQKQREAYLLY